MTLKLHHLQSFGELSTFLFRLFSPANVTVFQISLLGFQATAPRTKAPLLFGYVIKAWG